MKLIGATTLFMAAMCIVGVSAQDQTLKSEHKDDVSKTKESTKIDVKDGKDVTVMGCLERNPGGGYMLTSTATGSMRYALVTDDDLSKHINHRVEVFGKATDRGDAKVEITSKLKVDDKVGTSGDLNKKTKVEHEGDLGLKFLGVKSVKHLAGSCS